MATSPTHTLFETAQDIGFRVITLATVTLEYIGFPNIQTWDVKMLYAWSPDRVLDASEWPPRLSEESFIWDTERTPLAQLWFVAIAVPLYLLGTLILYKWMESRPAYKLTGVVSCHNFFLFVWSLAMCFGVSVDIWSRSDGLTSFVDSCFCVKHPAKTRTLIQGRLFYWAYLYYLSKYYELLDTFIVVLRKKEITFLHIFHHTCMVIFTFLWMNGGGPSYGGGWINHWYCVWINSLIHCPMYLYYFLMVRGVRLPKFFKPCLTILQELQHVSICICLALFLTHSIRDLRYDSDGKHAIIAYTQRCAGEIWVVLPSVLLAIALLTLFANFFFQTYVRKTIPNNSFQSKTKIS